MVFNRKVYQVHAIGKEGSSVVGTYSSLKKAQIAVGKLSKDWKPGDIMYFKSDDGEEGTDIFEKFIIESFDVQ